MERAIRNKKNKEIGKLLFYIGLLVIPLIQFAVFYVYVNINSVMLAFEKYDMQSGFSFAGFENFSMIFKNFSEDSIFRGAFTNTLLVLVLGLVIGTTLPVLVSYYIYKKRPFGNFFRVVLFLPSILSTLVLVIAYKYFCEVAVPEIWFKLFDKEIEGLLYGTDVSRSFFFVIFYCYWFGAGSSFLLYISTMSSISDSITEAANLDGFSPFQEFIFITLPLIFPTYTTFVVLNISVLFSNQLNLYSIYAEYAPNDMFTVGYYMYKETVVAGFEKYPYLAALGIFCTAIVVPLCLIIKRAMEKYGPSTD